MMGSPVLLCLAALLFASGVAEAQVVGSVVVKNPSNFDGVSLPIALTKPFVYAGRSYSQLYLDMNGFVSFFQPPDEFYPDPNVAKDGIFPLWADIENNEGGTVWYHNGKNSDVLQQVNHYFVCALGNHAPNATWVFLATWVNTPLELEAAKVTFQVALINDNAGHSYVMFLYEDTPLLVENWLAGFAVNNNSNFMKLPVKPSTAMISTSNVGIPGLWLFRVENEPNVNFFPIGPDAQENPFPFDGASVKIDHPFTYNGINYENFYLSMNGFVSFFDPGSLDEFHPDQHVGQDMIAPFWADIEVGEGGSFYYEQATDGPLLTTATYAINEAFHDPDFDAAWVFVATWQSTPVEEANAVVSFQLVLISDEYGRCYVLMNYGAIPLLSHEIWLAGFAVRNNSVFDNLPVANSSKLPLESNVGLSGRWAFQVSFLDICDILQCTEDEVCAERTGVYGCNCAKDNLRPNPGTFDAIETCSGGSGMVSLSRCQLFEAGYSAQFLHLNDDKCKGVMEGDRVVFRFDYEDDSCGTDFMNNGTHFMFVNNIQAIMGEGDQSVISRDNRLSIDVSCTYPLIQSISMSIRAGQSVIYRDLPTEGTYQILMTPYTDDSFSTQFSGDVTLEVNQQLYVSVDLVGLNSSEIVLVLDRCWATPTDDMNDNIYWDLISDECPNPEDGTVQVLLNGVSTSSRFSFRMFTFTHRSANIVLHCKVHLCLEDNGDCLLPCNGDDDDRRRRRSLDFHDTAAISMGF